MVVKVLCRECLLNKKIVPPNIVLGDPDDGLEATQYFESCIDHLPQSDY